MQDDTKEAEKPAEPVKTIDHNTTQAPTAARSDVGSKAV
jgi:sec-independent protein translocase protein TatA